MKLLKIQNYFKIFADLKFAILILAILGLLSSLGSFIEQDELLSFYQESYPINKPIYGFIDWKFIIFFGFDHLYNTWLFISLLLILGISLISCTITRQFPILFNAKEYFFKTKKRSFFDLNFFVRLKNIPYLKELILVKIQNLNFYTYQKINVIYGYKGLIGRISPILVHFSLIVILIGALLGAFKNFKAQEVLPKGEIFHIQNTIKIGSLTKLPLFSIRVNDFWTEYENNRIHQFYSNLSILDNLGNELKYQTISVNNPLRYQNVDFYQSDWNLLGVRIKSLKTNKIYEFPLFPLSSLLGNQGNKGKSWICWIPSAFEKKEFEQLDKRNDQKIIEKISLNSLNIPNKGLEEIQNTLIFDQFQNIFFVYNSDGVFLYSKNIGDYIIADESLKIIEILPSTGILIKYDPSINIIYFGFGILMITTLLSYLPYTQIWIFNKGRQLWLGSSTNRGKIQLELQFENLLRYSETNINFLI